MSNLEEAAAFTSSLTAYYGVVVSSKKVLLSDTSLRLMQQWRSKTQLAAGPNADAVADGPALPEDDPSYKGVHTVLSVGWNYDSVAASGEPSARGGAQWHSLALPFTELSEQREPPARRRVSSPPAFAGGGNEAAADAELGRPSAPGSPPRDAEQRISPTTEFCFPPPPFFCGEEDAPNASSVEVLDFCPPPPRLDASFGNDDFKVTGSPVAPGGVGGAEAAGGSETDCGSPLPEHEMRLSSVSVSRLSLVPGVDSRSSSSDESAALRQGIERVKRMLGLVKVSAWHCAASHIVYIVGIMRLHRCLNGWSCSSLRHASRVRYLERIRTNPWITLVLRSRFRRCGSP
jgi:hypothetical protein